MTLGFYEIHVSFKLEKWLRDGQPLIRFRDALNWPRQPVRPASTVGW